MTLEMTLALRISRDLRSKGASKSSCQALRVYRGREKLAIESVNAYHHGRHIQTQLVDRVPVFLRLTGGPFEQDGRGDGSASDNGSSNDSSHIPRPDLSIACMYRALFARATPHDGRE
jgi:hypothetical protein